ncbi:Methylamine utilization protein MauE [Opitutaceae bacterium TAV1]|nr:Methylamine utilization protein MauE [Opitutaceae bacterium TAV1]
MNTNGRKLRRLAGPGPVFCLRLFLTLLLAAAGVLKLADVGAFAADIENYRLLPAGAPLALAALLPWLEVTLAVAWWVPRLRLPAGVCALAMLEVFTAVVSSAWWQGLAIPAGCFGRVFPVSLQDVVFRNFVVILAAGALLLADIREAYRTRTGWQDST